MNGPNTGRLWKYVAGQLRLRRYLDQPGDGRQRPDLPARGLLWALLLGQLLRTYSFRGVEALVRSRARPNPRLPRRFGPSVTMRWAISRPVWTPARLATP